MDLHLENIINDFKLLESNPDKICSKSDFFVWLCYEFNVSGDEKMLSLFENYQYNSDFYPFTIELKQETVYNIVSLEKDELIVFEHPKYYDTGTDINLKLSKYQQITIQDTEHIICVLSSMFYYSFYTNQISQLDFDKYINSIINFIFQ